MRGSIRQHLLALSFCIALGVFFGTLSIVTKMTAIWLRNGWMDVPEGVYLTLIAVLCAVVVGGLVGLALGLVCADLISRKPHARTAMWIVVVVSPFVVVSAVISNSYHIILGLPALAFVCTCAVLSRRLTDRFPPRFCRNCSYNLTGNVSGVCPECGTEIKGSMMSEAFTIIRKARWAFLTGAAFVLLLSGIAICSNLVMVNTRGTHAAGLSGGVLWVGWRSSAAVDGRPFGGYGGGAGRFQEVNNEGFRLGFDGWAWFGWPRRDELFQRAGVKPIEYAAIPLILPFFLFAASTVILWRIERRWDPQYEGPAQVLGRWSLSLARRVESFAERRWRRRLLAVLRILSGLGVIIAAPLWWQSCRGPGHWNFLGHRDSRVALHADNGWLSVWRQPEEFAEWMKRPLELLEAVFHYRFEAREPPAVRFPLPVVTLVLLAFAAYPLLPPFRRAARERKGLCVQCAYDLTGNVSGLCPECGTTIEDSEPMNPGVN